MEFASITHSRDAIGLNQPGFFFRNFVPRKRCTSQTLKRVVQAPACSDKGPPWTMSWQLNERQTEWSETNKARLTGLIASHTFGSMEEFDERMEIVCAIVPSFISSLATMRPATLAAILEHPEHCANVMILLRNTLNDPTLDTGKVICKYPEALLLSEKQLTSALTALETLFGSMQAVASVLRAQPWALDADKVQGAIGNLKDLLDIGEESAIQMVADEPSILLSCIRCDASLGKSDYFEEESQSWRD